MADLSLDDDLLQDYLAECGEHLATIDNDVMAMEEAGAQIDERMVNRIFRAAHSLKGGAGLFGLVKIRDLAHQLEDTLDLIRSCRLVPTADVTGILLLGFDQIRELLRNHRESNQADTGAFATALAALTADENRSADGPAGVPPPDAGRQDSAFDCSRVRRSSNRIYLIDYDLIEDIERRSKTNWEVFRDLLECGTILETVFDLESAGTLDGEPSNRLMLELVYATVLDPEVIGHVVQVPPERIRLIENDGAMTPLAGLTAEPAVAQPAPAPPGSTICVGPGIEPATGQNPRVEIQPPGAEVVAASVPELRSQMRRMVDAGIRELVVDFRNVRMVDSTGIGLLVTAHNTLCKLGGRLSVANASKDILDLFQSMRIHRHFRVSGVGVEDR